MNSKRLKFNSYDLTGTYGKCRDFLGQNEFVFDKEDFEKINKCYWLKDSNGYWKGSLGWLHRLIMGAQEKEYVDHINHNKDDCRKENMRICDNSENNRNRGLQSNNTSGVAGVSWSKKEKKWRVRIKIYGKEKHIGFFDNIEDAKKAREKAENIYYREYSYNNSVEASTYVQ